MLVEAGSGFVAFGFKLAKGSAVLVDEVVVPGEGAALDIGEVVSYELLDTAAEFADGLGARVGWSHGVEGLAGRGEQ